MIHLVSGAGIQTCSNLQPLDCQSPPPTQGQCYVAKLYLEGPCPFLFVTLHSNCV